MKHRIFRSALSVILVLCMLVSTPIAAFAATPQTTQNDAALNGAEGNTEPVPTDPTPTEPQPDHEHSYTSVVTAPTCTQKGYTTYTCSICGNSYKGDEVAAMGHSWDEGKITTDPTYTETGIRTYTCITCKSTKTETVPVVAHDHKYGEAVVTAPTCTEKGYTSKTCSLCGEVTKDSEVAALGHDEEVTKGTPATCTQDGVTDSKRCKRCGEVTAKAETIPSPGHSWDEGKVTKEPTLETTGTKVYTCTVCKETKTEVIPVLSHNYETVISQPTCTEKGYITYTCTICGDTYKEERADALGHNEVVTAGKPATCTEAGLSDGKHCDRCDTELAKQEVIPATGHKFENGVCTVCGAKENAGSLEAPEILSCYSKLQTSVKVTWTLVDGADGYELWRTATPDKDDSWTRAKTVADGSKDRYTNQGLEKGTTYYYKVRAYVEDASGNRTYSDFSNVDYMPAAVVWDDPYSNATFRIRLRWDEIGGAHGYQIWRLNADGETWSVIKTLGDKNNTLTNNQGATTAYSNTGLTAGGHYTYKMRAFTIPEDGKKVFGAYSDEFTIAVMPEAPVVSASAQSGRVQLAWEAINGAAGYQIWMLENGSWNIVKSLTDGSTTYTKYDLEGGVEYQFKVRAYTEVDGKKTFGAYSEIVASTPAVEYKGKCGDNLTWKVADRVLTISGTGAMYDYSEAARPWDGLDFGLVSIKSGVTTIGADAFSGLIAHQYNLPDTLTKIGSRAFAGCQITQIAIPASVTQIDEMAFAQTNLTSVTLPKGLTILSYGVFEHTDITEIEIPAGVTTIDANAFYACAKLADVSLPNSLVTIGTNAFAQCDALEIAILPDSVTTMGIGVFEYSNKLASVYLPAGITDIPARTFYGCSSLVEVVLPAGVTFISDNAFHGCNSLTNILYLGTEEQISQLEIADGNDPLLNADLYLVTMITEQPADQTVKAGEKVTFHVETSREGCTYQWYCLAPDSEDWVACTQSGNKTDTLSFTATADLNGYYFLCEITDPYGNAGDTDAALLTVK